MLRGRQVNGTGQKENRPISSKLKKSIGRSKGKIEATEKLEYLSFCSRPPAKENCIVGEGVDDPSF